MKDFIGMISKELKKSKEKSSDIKIEIMSIYL